MVDTGSPREDLRRQQEVSRQFEAHYEQYTREVTARLRYRFPTLRTYCEDIAQEALSRTYAVWLEGRGRAGSSPLPYMHKVAYNLAVDACTSREQPLEDVYLLPEIDRKVVHRQEVVTPLDPVLEIAMPAMANMRNTQRKSVVEQQIRGKDVESIAEGLQISRQQVRSLSSKAAGELREMEEVRLHIRPGHQRKRRRGEEDTGE